MGQDPEIGPEEEPESELKPSPYPKIGTGPVLEKRPPELLGEADADSAG